jgi:hypothetical protein
VIHPRALPRVKPGSTARGVRLQPKSPFGICRKSVFDFVGIRRSACPEMAVRFRPFCTAARGAEFVSVCRFAAALSTQPSPQGCARRKLCARWPEMPRRHTVDHHHEPRPSGNPTRRSGCAPACSPPPARRPSPACTELPTRGPLARACSSADTARQSATDGPDRGFGGRLSLFAAPGTGFSMSQLANGGTPRPLHAIRTRAN